MRHEGQEPEGGDGARAGNVRWFRIPSARRPARGLPARNERRHAAARDDRAGARLENVLADGPTHKALDATVQIQILLLLRELQREFGRVGDCMTHDIGVAIEICDRVAVVPADPWSRAGFAT